MSEVHVWGLVQRWMDGQVIRVNQSQLADALGVSRQIVSAWKAGESRPSPASLRRIANVTRIPYAELTAALLLDMGYVGPVEEPARPPVRRVEATRLDVRRETPTSGRRPIGD